MPYEINDAIINMRRKNATSRSYFVNVIFVLKKNNIKFQIVEQDKRRLDAILVYKFGTKKKDSFFSQGNSQ